MNSNDAILLLVVVLGAVLGVLVELLSRRSNESLDVRAQRRLLRELSKYDDRRDS